MNVLKIYDPKTGEIVERVRISRAKDAPSTSQMIRAFNRIGYCTKDQLPAARKELKLKEVD